jgi:hypothetical protein
VLRQENYHLAILEFYNNIDPNRTQNATCCSTTPTQTYRSSGVGVHAGRPAVITNRKRNRHRVLNRQTDVLRNHPENVIVAAGEPNQNVRLTLLITPTNVKYPGPALTKEPVGIVIVKLPIWSVTGSAGGLIPLMVFPRVKLELIEKPG